MKTEQKKYLKPVMIPLALVWMALSGIALSGCPHDYTDDLKNFEPNPRPTALRSASFAVTAGCNSLVIKLSDGAFIKTFTKTADNYSAYFKYNGVALPGAVTLTRDNDTQVSITFNTALPVYTDNRIRVEAEALRDPAKKVSVQPEVSFSWTFAVSPFVSTDQIWTVIYGGDRYVAGADNGKIAWSTDGVTWNLVTISSFNVTGAAVRGIAYNPNQGANGRYVAVGYNGQLAYSDDKAVTWTAVTTHPFSTKSLLAITYGNGYFITGGDNGILARSPDGIGWNKVAGDAGDGMDSPFSKTLAVLSIAYGEDTALDTGRRGVFAAVGVEGRAAYSNDNGNTWVWAADQVFFEKANAYENYGARMNAAAVTFGKGYFAAAGDGGNIKLATPYNLVNYDTKWYAWGNGSGTDGVDSKFGSDTILGVTYGNGAFLAVGDKGKMAKSGDGITWRETAVKDGSGALLFTAADKITCIGYGNNRFVIGNNNGKIAYSSN